MKLYYRTVQPETTGVKSFIFHEDKLLLVRLGYAHKKWALPGGKVDKGETLEIAAKRELFEESGQTVDHIEQFGSTFSCHEGKQNTVYYFTGTTGAQDLIIDGQEIIDAGWFSLDRLPDNCAPRLSCEIELYNKMYGK